MLAGTVPGVFRRIKRNLYRSGYLWGAIHPWGPHYVPFALPLKPISHSSGETFPLSFNHDNEFLCSDIYTNQKWLYEYVLLYHSQFDTKLHYTYL